MAARRFSIYCAVLALIQPTLTDIYLHNPRGSNNRHNENTPDRTTPTLSFNSQNNDRGGYNVGDGGTMYYYAGSILPIQWTNQHSCDDVNNDCTILLQYTCSDNLRDGLSTQIIPITVDGENNSTYRLTEDLTSYLNCRVRSRNKNLFTATQGLQGNSAIYTRQNPTGTRYGYECPEERDYYPYWQQTNWTDIAILTNRQDLCSYYRQNSQNVQSRFACVFGTKAMLIQANQTGVILPITQDACNAFNYTFYNVSKPIWQEFASQNQPAPECYTPSYTRENHLGDVFGSEMATFNWTIPSTTASKCLLRIRYNISTADYDGWNTNATSNQGNLYIMQEYFGNRSATQQRGYQYQTNPQIQLFSDLGLKLQLAINTAQYGRVFEDRSFTFQVRPRPAEYGNQPIYNLNVRGRRGNIVQVYPAVEYDFVPNRLETSANSYIHVQWIGSNTTPPGAGQGNANIDRSNLLMLTERTINPSWDPYGYLNFTGLLNANIPEYLNQSNFFGLSRADLRLLAASGQNTDPLLINSSAYFDLGPRLVPVGSAGVYHYVSTRNNDFSNRDQKGQIIVQPFDFKYFLLGRNTYTIPIDQAVIIVPEGAVNESVSVKLSKLSSDQLPKILPGNSQQVTAKEQLYSDVYVIEPYDQMFSSQIEVQIPLQTFDNDQNSVTVLQFQPQYGVFMKLPTTVTNNNGRQLSFRSDIAGVYVFVKTQKDLLWIAGIVIPVVLLLIIIISTIIYFRLSPSRYTKVKDQLSKTKRSFFSRI